MISLNDYLFSGNTVLKILHQYSNDLRNSAKETHNSIDLAHSNFLIQIIELLEHNDFLTSQSQHSMAISLNLFTTITRKMECSRLKPKLKAR